MIYLIEFWNPEIQDYDTRYSNQKETLLIKGSSVLGLAKNAIIVYENINNNFKIGFKDEFYIAEGKSESDVLDLAINWMHNQANIIANKLNNYNRIIDNFK